jgi:CDP-glucose 4,6-dehydratase
MQPLSGYLRLARRLIENGPVFSGGWNFGPAQGDSQTVGWIAEQCARLWGGGACWQRDTATYLPEARSLRLDSSRALAELEWRPRFALPSALGMTVEWYQRVAGGADARSLCEAQLAEFGDEELV